MKVTLGDFPFSLHHKRPFLNVLLAGVSAGPGGWRAAVPPLLPSFAFQVPRGDLLPPSAMQDQEPLRPSERRVESLGTQAGGEGGGDSRLQGTPRFPQRAPRGSRKCSRQRRGCHGSGDAPQASSCPGGEEAAGGGLPLLPLGQSGRGAPSWARGRFHPFPLQEVNKGLHRGTPPPAPAFPYGLFTGFPEAGGECSLTLTAARELFGDRCPSSSQCLPGTTERASDALVSTEPLLGFCEAFLNLINNVKSLYRRQKCSF